MAEQATLIAGDVHEDLSGSNCAFKSCPTTETVQPPSDPPIFVPSVPSSAPLVASPSPIWNLLWHDIIKGEGSTRQVRAHGRAAQGPQIFGPQNLKKGGETPAKPDDSR